MKALAILLLLLSSLSAWSANCDLTEAHRDRSVLIEACLENGQIEGLSKDDLKATRNDLSTNLEVAAEDFRLQIEFEISNDKIGMATQIMMERDKEKLRVANLIALIDSLLKKIS